jgi:hypothetical protein
MLTAHLYPVPKWRMVELYLQLHGLVLNSAQGQLHDVLLTTVSVLNSSSNSWLHGAEAFVRSCQWLSCRRIPRHFVDSKGSLPCTQEPSTGPYPEPDEASPYHSILCLIRSILILPPTHLTVCFVVSFLLISPSKSYMHFSSPHACYIPCQYHLLDSIILVVRLKMSTNYEALHYAIFLQCEKKIWMLFQITVTHWWLSDSLIIFVFVVWLVSDMFSH